MEHKKGYLKWFEDIQSETDENSGYEYSAIENK